MRRVLDPEMKLRDQIIVLIASKGGSVSVADLFDWTGYGNKSYFMKILREFHDSRWIELAKDERSLEALPPGDKQAAIIVSASVHALA
jgi:hypothetical protein